MSTKRVVKKSAEIRKLHNVLRRVEEILLLSDPNGDRAKHIHASEDPIVLELCRRHGFGAVMDSAARQWRNLTLEEGGNIGAHTTGACVGTVQGLLKEVRAALKGKFE